MTALATTSWWGYTHCPPRNWWPAVVHDPLAAVSLTGVLVLVCIIAAIICVVQAVRFASLWWLLIGGGCVLLALIAQGGVTR